LDTNLDYHSIQGIPQFHYLQGKQLVDDQLIHVLNFILPGIKNVRIELTVKLANNVAGRYIPEGFRGMKEHILINTTTNVDADKEYILWECGVSANST